MLATSVWTAVKDALKSVGSSDTLPVRLDSPMLAHRVLDEIERLSGCGRGAAARAAAASA